MAEVSNLHRQQHAPPPTSTRQPESPPIEEPFNQSRPFEFFPSYNRHFFFDDYTTSFDFDSVVNQDFEYDEDDPNSFFEENDDEQMHFVTNLFESSNLVREPVREMGSGLIDVEFGFGPGLGLDLDLERTDSESEFEFEVNSRFIDDENVNNSVCNDEVFEIDNGNEFEWEEVSERFNFDERDALNSVINRIEELSVSDESDVASSRSEEEEDGTLGDDEGEEEVEGSLEWEVLLEMNILERNLEIGLGEGDEDGSDVDVEIRGEDGELPEDYILAMEYDALFGQLVENENAVKGSPPASKSVVENLPVVVLRKEEGGEEGAKVVCAVCNDEVDFGDRVMKMPCCHLYHGECIVPWLRIRNTCPVCRFELPTDDADYEKRKNETGGSRLSDLLVDDLEDEARYNFEFFP